MNEAPSVPRPPTPRPGATAALVDLSTGRVHFLRSGRNAIGRSPRSRIVLDDRAVSRRHAVVMIHGAGECEIGDPGSRNGVLLNGGRLQGIARLTTADLIQIGDFRFLFLEIQGGDSGPVVFPDETLGAVAWNEVQRCWHFGVADYCGRFVPASYRPADPTPLERLLPTATPEWEAVRALYRQVKARDAEVRILGGLRVGGSLAERFLPPLTHVLFVGGKAMLVYEGGAEGAVRVVFDLAGRVASSTGWVGGDQVEGD